MWKFTIPKKMDRYIDNCKNQHFRKLIEAKKSKKDKKVNKRRAVLKIS